MPLFPLIAALIHAAQMAAIEAAPWGLHNFLPPEPARGHLQDEADRR
ncbi:hypothetical protein [Chelatococcus sp. XZ-Ab1]|nr:hypothetical protein [Chelatococcus sp. XZ-Ab1]